MMKEWKRDKHSKVRHVLSTRFKTFDQLEGAVRPLLLEHFHIFSHYGPDDVLLTDAARYSQWMKTEPVLLANNSKILDILTANINLLAKPNRELVEHLRVHFREFEVTRPGGSSERVTLFPQELNSLFRVFPSFSSRPTENIEALENFIRRLVSESRFRDIDLAGDGVVYYTKREGGLTSLSIYDCTRAFQEYWNSRSYPAKMRIRLSDLIWLLRWMERTDIQWSIPDPTQLTTVDVGTHKVVFVHEYICGIAALTELTLIPGSIVVNTNEWGSGGFTREAEQYAEGQGCRTITRSEFFAQARTL